MKRTPSQILRDMESPGERRARRVILSLLVTAVVLSLFV